MAAPVPELDPPGERVRSHGFFGIRNPVSGSGQPVAYSWRPSLPVMTAPAARSFVMTWASRPSPQAGSITRLFAVVGASFVAMMSLTPSGMPWSGPLSTPAAKSASAWRAAASAASSVMAMKAAMVSWVACERASRASVSATAVIRPDRSHSAASVMVIGTSTIRSSSPVVRLRVPRNGRALSAGRAAGAGYPGYGRRSPSLRTPGRIGVRPAGAEGAEVAAGTVVATGTAVGSGVAVGTAVALSRRRRGRGGGRGRRRRRRHERRPSGVAAWRLPRLTSRAAVRAEPTTRPGACRTRTRARPARPASAAGAATRRPRS